MKILHKNKKEIRGTKTNTFKEESGGTKSEIWSIKYEQWGKSENIPRKKESEGMCVHNFVKKKSFNLVLVNCSCFKK